MKVAKNDSLWNDWKLLINFFVKNLLQYMYIYIHIFRTLRNFKYLPRNFPKKKVLINTIKFNMKIIGSTNLVSFNEANVRYV